jgi:hypothetical protein
VSLVDGEAEIRDRRADVWKAFDREAQTITLHARDAKTRKNRVL